jgi:hypothetical protein
MKMKKIMYLLLIITTAACKKKEEIKIEPKAPNVYVCGYDYSNNVFKATYWVNGVSKSLSDNSFLNDIAVSGNDVYVTGRSKVGAKYIARMWKNGTSTDLTSGATDAEAIGVFLNANDIYITGYESNPNPAWQIGKIWKNGIQKTLLPTFATVNKNCIVTDVIISGNDEYAIGYYASGTFFDGCYWKNGVKVDLTPITGFGTMPVNAMTVVANDLYIVGARTLGSGLPKLAVVWKNGIKTDLTSGVSNAEALDIYVSGNDIYVAGYEYNATVSIAKYWKNGTPVILSNGTDNASARGITVVGTDVYVCGRDGNTAVVWKNGVATSLPNGVQANKIMVAP